MKPRFLLSIIAVLALTFIAVRPAAAITSCAIACATGLQPCKTRCYLPPNNFVTTCGQVGPCTPPVTDGPAPSMSLSLAPSSCDAELPAAPALATETAPTGWANIVQALLTNAARWLDTVA